MEISRCVNCMEETAEAVCPYCGYDESRAEQISYTLKRNTILHGRYLVGNMLGQGGFGITYIGFDMMLNIKVAIKEYYPMGYVSRDCSQSNRIVWGTVKDGQTAPQRGCDEFLSEARRMAQIDVLPEIVRVRDTFMENGTAYIVMDYVQGQTLKSFMLQHGVMGFAECVDMLLPLMRSLAEVHKRGIIHRDISPDNIMIEAGGKIRLLDLGAAKELNLNDSGNSQLVTRKGFSPAEQCLEGGRIGTWTDVYAMCATIYYCITGKLAPASLERMSSDRDTLSFDVPMKEPLGEKAKNVLRKGLAVKSENRTQTVEELIDGLEKAVRKKTDIKDLVKKIVIGCMAAFVVVFLVVKVIPNRKQDPPNPTPTTEPDPTPATESHPEPEPDPVPPTQNVLMKELDVKDEDENKWVLGNENLNRSSIVSVNFLASLTDMQDDAWDVSKDQNGNVMAWTTPDNDGLYHLFIAGNGGVMADDCSNLFAYYDNVKEILFNECFHTEQMISTYKMFFKCDKLEHVETEQLDTGNVENMGFMFQECSSLEQLNLSSFKTDKVTNMENMFCSCKALKEIDVNGFRTGNVKSMFAMFYECSSPEVLDVSGLETENVTTMAYMFGGCSSLKNLQMGKWNTGHVEDMKYMFCNCSGLDSIELNFNTSQVANMQGIFQGCSALEQIDLSNFITGRVTNMSNMFRDCSALKELDVSTFNTGSVTAMDAMFQGCSGLTELDVSGFNTQNVTVMNYMFYDCSNLRTLNVSTFNTGNVTTMNAMFCMCSSLTELDVSGFNTQKVTDMENMFWGCSNIKELDVSKFDTGSVTIMHGMFCKCFSLTELDVSRFNTQNVTSMQSMFYECKNIKKLDASGFDTQNVTNMSWMFNRCSNIKELDLSTFNTSGVTTMKAMFGLCSSLEELDVSGFDTHNVTDMSYMFSECGSLRKLDLGGFDMSQVSERENMLADVPITEEEAGLK